MSVTTANNIKKITTFIPITIIPKKKDNAKTTIPSIKAIAIIEPTAPINFLNTTLPPSAKII